MFLDSQSFVSSISKVAKIGPEIAFVTKFNSSNLPQLDLVVDTGSSLEALVEINSGLNYNFSVKQNSKLKLILIIDNQPQDLELNISIDLEDIKASTEIYILNKQNTNLTSLNLQINHLGKQTKSQTIVKSINSDSSKFKADATICIPKGKLDCEANMSLKGLLLDQNSQINFKPNLKILESQVICSHGATISSFEKTYLEYFYSRGIDQNQAKNLLLKSFESGITNQIPLVCLNNNQLAI